MKHDKYVVAYLLEYIKNTVSESEYQEVIEDMNEIREKTIKESPHLEGFFLHWCAG